MSVPVFAVVGHPNKGKSSIVSTLASDDSVRIGPEPGTTRHGRRFPMRVDGRELYVLVDTPGFQRARRALEWMRRHEKTADLHPAVVREFVAAHQPTEAFPDECELLAPIVEGAGILYVVDGSVPYGEEYEPEMEILRWTGQPSMALINPIGQADYTASWQAGLGQYFRVVRVFNPVMGEFRKRTELLRAFGQLREAWREPLEEAVTLLEADRVRIRRLAAEAIAEALGGMLGHRLERRVRVETDLREVRDGLEARYRSDLRRMEARCRGEVEGLYSHRRIDRRETELGVAAEDLFSEKTWLLFGLGKRELIASGALGGAAAGAVMDAHLAGASLLLGAAAGAGVGGFLGWWTADRLIRVKVFNVALGGKRVVAGPTRNVNFPHVVLNRARYHHHLVSRRSHAVRGELRIGERAEAVVPPIDRGLRGRVDRCLSRLRREPGSGEARRDLAELIGAVLESDENSGEASVGGLATDVNR